MDIKLKAHIANERISDGLLEAMNAINQINEVPMRKLLLISLM